ncbi:hypothetical protein RchiOBHm_Chr2g0114591 [Rosa chinensis]|uniref:AARP2CN domain-containing protein n=1 Tax=Rosa chinensis TaxID=74649 RepID=A0A2P6RQU1_ROSCH|nr:hypothetical protein RchiOBHm_Chr2g0114591 [Rosa chinensis]
MDSGTKEQSHKGHRARQSGPKANKKPETSRIDRWQNHRAFAFNSTVKAKRLQYRAVEKEQNRPMAKNQLHTLLWCMDLQRKHLNSLIYCKFMASQRLWEFLLTLINFKEANKLKKTKQHLKHRFWTEIYDGAKLFYLSGLDHGKFVKREIHNLARFISVMKFHPLSWQTAHPYVLVDRFEDVTPPENVHMNNKCDRNVTHYGYLRGVGDYNVSGMTAMTDPCPLPSAARKKGLSNKEKLFYAPMSGIGNLLYDKDAVYININDHFVQYSHVDDKAEATDMLSFDDYFCSCVAGKCKDLGVNLVKSLQSTKYSVDEKLEQGSINLFNRKPNLSLETQRGGKDTSESREQICMIENSEDYQSGEATKADAADIYVLTDSEYSGSDRENCDASYHDATHKDQLMKYVDFHNGRSRRKVIFGNGFDDNDMKDSNDEAEVEDGDEDDNDNDDVDNCEYSGSESSGEDEQVHGTDDDMGNIAKWKESLAERTFLKQTTNLIQHSNLYMGNLHQCQLLSMKKMIVAPMRKVMEKTF